MDLSGKRLVVIGGAGLIGSHTVDALVNEDVGSIVVYDTFSARQDREPREALRDPRVSIFELGGDICGTDILDAALKDADGVPLRRTLAASLPRLPALGLRRERGRHVQCARGVRNGVERLCTLVASVYGDAVEEPMTESHPFNNRSLWPQDRRRGDGPRGARLMMA